MFGITQQKPCAKLATIRQYQLQHLTSSTYRNFAGTVAVEVLAVSSDSPNGFFKSYAKRQITGRRTERSKEINGFITV